MDDFYQEKVKLDKERMDLLFYYALAMGDVTDDMLKAYARRIKLPIKKVRESVDELCKKGYLEEQYQLWNGTFVCRISQRYYMAALRELAKNKDCEVATSYNSYSEIDPESRRFMKIFLQGVGYRMVSLSESTFSKDKLAYLYGMPFYPEFHPIFLQMTSDLLCDFLCVFFREHTRFDLMLSRETYVNFITNIDTGKRSCSVYESIHLFEYIYWGENNLDTCQTYFGYAHKALKEVYAGDYEKACLHFKKAIKLYKEKYALLNATMASFPFMAPFLAYAHVIAAEHTPEYRLDVLYAYNSLSAENALPARAMSMYLLNDLETFPKHIIDKMLESDDFNITSLAILFLYYVDGFSEESDYGVVIPISEMMQYECSPAIPKSMIGDIVKNGCQFYGPHPLIQTLAYKPRWEKTLDRLSENYKNRGAKAERNTRFFYTLRDYRVEIRQQVRMKSGKWSPGKLLTDSQMYYADFDNLEECDAEILQMVHRRGTSCLCIENIVPLLVGDDRVSRKIKNSGTAIPVRIVEEKPYIVVEKSESGFRLSSNFEINKPDVEVFSNSVYVVLCHHEDSFVVIPISEQDREFYKSLMEIGTFPLEAEGRLKEFFPMIKKVVNVYSDDFSEDMHVDTVDAFTSLSLQVTRTDGAFLVHACVRLLADSDVVVLPGEGAAIKTVGVKNNQVWVKRDIEKEKRNYKELEKFYRSLDIQVPGKEDNVSLFIDEFLQLTDFVRNNPDKYSLEWKEGEALKFLKPKEDMEWDIHLNRNKAGWFELEGDITLDDDKVVSMSQLLALLSEDSGRFIRLDNDEYIVLSDNLRKQMRRMEGVMVKNRGKMQLPALQAGLLTDDMLAGEIKIKGDQALSDMRERVKKSAALKPRVPKTLNATLRDYQSEGFRWMARLNNWGAGACLADDMGLGKTVQTIAYLLYKASAGASLVVAPASVVPNWSKELERFAPSLHVKVLNSAADREECIKSASKNDVVLSTYGLLVPNEEYFAQKKWNVVCLDEAHVIKNRDTKTSGVAMQLQATNKLILTGTPVQNHLGELWNLFQFINPYLLGSYEQFKKRFIEPIELNHDTERQAQLNALVHPFMLRRTKSEVVNELPDKEEIVIPVELSEDELAIYESIRRRAKKLVEMGGSKVSVATLAEITKLRQAACCAQLVEKKWKGESSKVNRLVDLMQELRENGHRALVFSQFTSFFNVVRKVLDKEKIPYFYLDGSVPMAKREELVREFQEGDCPFFLISLKAGGLGLNLTGANYVIHLDPWWNPAIEQQATDRAYRIGQTQKVTAYHLVSSHTIEEKILRLHETKRNLSDAVLSGMDTSHKITADELMEILSQEQDA